jgi:predicted O-methyltransferase YrrM
MAPALARLARSRDRAGVALRRAVATTLLGRVAPEEVEWINEIEAARTELLANGTPTAPAFDPGVEGPKGRFTMVRQQTTVGVAAEFISLPPTWCLFMMRLIRELSPQSCLELGTGVGISTAYQAAALELNGTGNLTTLEGSSAWAELARKSLAGLGLRRVNIRVGPIAETLPQEVERGGPFDFVFIDAEHQADATLDQFRTMLPGLADEAMLAFDDVDWPEMKRAHAEIARQKLVSRSVSLGRLGVSVISRRELAAS